MRPLPTFPPASRRTGAPWLLAALSMLAATPAHAETADGLGRQGNKLYAEKRVDEAVDAYSRAIELEPQSAALLYNLGTALALKDKYDEAEKALQQAATLAASPKLKTDARFNRAYNLAAPAMALANQPASAAPADPKAMESAIAGLREAIAIQRTAIGESPDDVELIGNYEKMSLALRELLERQAQQQQQQNQQGQGDQQKDGQQGQQGQQQQQNQQGNQQGQQQGQQGGDPQQQGQQQQQNQQNQQNGDQQKPQDQQGQQQKPDPQKDQQQGQQQQQQPQNQQGQGEKESETPRASQQSGLEGQATPTPTPAPQGQQQAAGQAGKPDSKSDAKPEGSAVGGSAAQPSQPLTPERANAQRLLNMLEEENPEQFRKLFQFRGQAEQPPARDW